MVRAMYIVAAKTGDATTVHYALHEIVSLHAVFMRRAVRKMREAQFAQPVRLQRPEVRQIQAGAIADGPVVGLGANGRLQRPPLGMAGDAGIVGPDVVFSRGVEDGPRPRIGHMGAARAMALLAADIPFRRRLGLDVVIDRMTTVAERACGALHVVVGIKSGPPV